MSLREKTEVTEASDQVVTEPAAKGGAVAWKLLKLRDFRYALISSAVLVFGFEMRAVVQS